MPDLTAADSVLASALDRLDTLHVGTTSELNSLQVLRAQLHAVRSELASVRSRLGALEAEDRTLTAGPPGRALANDARFAAIFAHALDAMLIADDSRRYVDANPAACALLGYTRDELVARTVEDVTPEEHRHLVASSWQEFITLGTLTGEYLVRHRDGRRIAVEFRAIANILPGEHLSILRDVTKLRSAQRDLRDVHQRERSEALTGLYRALDTLVAVSIELRGASRRRDASAPDFGHELGPELDRALADIRAAIVSIESSGPAG